jgi:hypothetical protein
VPSAGIGMGRRESASFQSAVAPRPLHCSSVKSGLAEGPKGLKVVEAMVQIDSGRQMSTAKKGRPGNGTPASASLRLGYGVLTKQKRGQNLRSTATLPVFSQSFQLSILFAWYKEYHSSLLDQHPKLLSKVSVDECGCTLGFA